MIPERTFTRNCVLAVRVSSRGQGIDGDSPDAQIEQGKAYAAANNLRITMILTYLESANVVLGLQPMQHVIDYAIDPKNDIQVVLIKSIDRFTRGGSTIYDLLRQRLDPHNVDLVDMHGVISNVKVNTLEHLGVSYKWSEHRPSRTAELLAAEHANSEVREILTRMIGSEIRYTQIGYWSRGARYGYKNEKIDTVNGKRVLLADNGLESEIIRKMYDLRAAGVLSDDQVAAEMNRMGFKTPIKVVRDKQDHMKIVSRTGGKPMTGKLLRVYVAKTIYAGINTEKWTNGKPVVCKFKGLVSIELFNKANRGKIHITLDSDDPDHAIVGRTKKQEKFVKKNVFNNEFPYRKIVSCPHCKHLLLGSASRGRLGKYYPAYHCSHHGHYYRIPKKDFDVAIMNFIEHVQVNPARLDEVTQAVMTVWEQRKAQAHVDTENRDKRREELEAQIKVIVDKLMLVSSPTAIKHMEEELTKLEQQIVDLETRKEEEATKETIDMPTILTYIKYFVEHMKDLLIDHCNPVLRARYFGVIFDEVPTYEEINCGSAEIEKIPGVNELFKLAHSQEVSLVRLMRSYCIYFYREAGLVKLLAQAQGSRRPAAEIASVKKMHLLTEPEIDVLVSRYQDGESLVELGRALTVHEQTIRAHLVRRGIPLRAQRHHVVAGKRLVQAVEWYQAGRSLKSIGDVFSVDPNTVRRALRAAGVEIRPNVCGRRAT